MIDEHELLAKWAAGGKRGELAFNQLYAKYDAKVRRDASRLNVDPDDTSQDVWLRVTQDMRNGAIGNYGEFQAYLYTVTQKAAERDAVGRNEPVGALDSADESELPTSPSAEDVVAAGELQAVVDTAVANMRRSLRDAWAHKRRGNTDAMAAHQLAISERTYRDRVATARAIINEALERAADFNKS